MLKRLPASSARSPLAGSHCITRPGTVGGAANRPGAAFAILLCLCAVPQAGASGWDLDRLMRAVAANAQQPLSYREEKLLGLLETPLRSSGRLRVVPPNTLLREVLEPYRVRYVIGADDLITMEQEDQPPRVVQLGRVPAAAAMVGTLRALLLGDRSALEQLYRLKVNGDPNAWTLELEPRDTELARHIDLLRVEGTEGHIRFLSILERNGDHTRMELRPDE